MASYFATVLKGKILAVNEAAASTNTKEVSVCLHVFCRILFALKPFRDYSLCSVRILPSLRFTLSL